MQQTMKQLGKLGSMLIAATGLAFATGAHAAPAKRAVPACTVVNVSATTTVAAGATFDGLAHYGKWVCLVGTSTNMNGNQSEGQIPHFILNQGSTLKNVILGDPTKGTGRNLTAGGADGVHCKGSCRIENVYWGDVGEDAATMESSAPDGSVMTVVGGAAYKASDKIFQNNGPMTRISISDFYAEEAGKLYRSCGNCSSQYVRYVTINGVRLYNVNAGLGVNSSFDASRLPSLKGQYDVGNITDLVSNKTSSLCVGYVGTSSGHEPVKDTSSSNIARSCVFH